MKRDKTPLDIIKVARQIDENIDIVMQCENIEQSLSLIQYLELLWNVLLDFMSSLIPTSKPNKDHNKSIK